MVGVEDDGNAVELLELAGAVDRALQHHDRCAARAGSEELLDFLLCHHRKMRSVRARCDRFTADLIETETVCVIALVALTIGDLMEGTRWPDSGLRRGVGELIDVESDAVTAAAPGGVECTTV